MPIGRLRFVRRKPDDSSFQQRERFVRVIYERLLHREPEDGALKHWVEALSTQTHAEILQYFLNCEEFTQGSEEKFFVPPGHYYSPIVNVAEAEAHLRRMAALEPQRVFPG